MKTILSFQDDYNRVQLVDDTGNYVVYNNRKKIYFTLDLVYGRKFFYGYIQQFILQTGMFSN